MKPIEKKRHNFNGAGYNNLKFIAQVSEEVLPSLGNENRRITMKAKFMAYLKDEGGQTSTEYILLLAVVAAIVYKFKDTASQRLLNLTDGVFTKADTLLDDI